MKRGWMYLAAGVIGLLVLCAGESKAGEFGGFQVDIGVGENTAVPGDWEEEQDFSQNVTEDSDMQEESWQDNGGNTWETPEENAGGFGRQSENMEVDTGNPTVLENSGEENGGDSEEEFLFSDGSEYEGYLPQRDSYESLEEPETDLKSEIVPTVTPLTTVTPAPVSNQAGEEISIKEIPPRLLYWKGEIASGQPVSLEITAKGEVKVLSFRINGKENGWKWKGDRIEASKYKHDSHAETTVAELILLYYDDSVHGIFIDGNRKQ